MFSSQPYIIKGPRSDNHVCDWITVKMITSIIIDIKEYSLLLHWPHKYTMLIAYPLATYMTSHKSQLHHSFPVGTDQIPSLLPPQFVQRLIASLSSTSPFSCLAFLMTVMMRMVVLLTWNPLPLPPSYSSFHQNFAVFRMCIHRLANSTITVSLAFL